MDWNRLLGLKVKALRGYPSERFGKPYVPLSVVLFDDGETFMEFKEQDYYDNHDCSHSARHVDLYKDAELWRKMFDKQDGFDVATDTDCPFY